MTWHVIMFSFVFIKLDKFFYRCSVSLLVSEMNRGNTDFEIKNGQRHVASLSFTGHIMALNIFNDSFKILITTFSINRMLLIATLQQIIYVDYPTVQHYTSHRK